MTQLEIPAVIEMFPTPAANSDRRRRIGYAARPGTGPKKQRCNTCSQMERVLHKGRHSHKCLRMAGIWSGDPVTDIKPGAPACSEWERKPFRQAAG